MNRVTKRTYDVEKTNIKLEFFLYQQVHKCKYGKVFIKGRMDNKT